MKQFFTMSVLFLAALLVGCGDGGTPAVVKDTPEILSKAIAGNMRTMAEILNSIADEASAKAAVPKIEEARKNMRSVAARAKALPKLSAVEVKASDAAMQKDLSEVMPLIIGAKTKLDELIEKNPEIKKILEPALTGMENDM